MAARQPALVRDQHGTARCWWCDANDLYRDYHDLEWGRPVLDDVRLFEKLCLEGFQAGLSWITVLRKREAFREAFAQFDFQRVARFTPKRIDRLVANPGIIRHRGKITSTVNNAARAIELIEEFGTLRDYVWQFVPSRRRTHRRRSTIPAETAESAAMSKDLKRRGWSFVGPTTCYAFMQAMGLVNDHLVGCHVWQEVEELQLSHL